MNFIQFSIYCFLLSFQIGSGLFPSHGKAVVCVIAEETVYPEERSEFRIENMDGSLCTHIVGIDKNWLKPESMASILFLP